MNVCRTCFSRYGLSPLFDDFSVVKFSSDQLLLATGVQISPNDGFSQSVCIKCIKTISKALELRELSAKVDQILRTITKHIVIKTEPNDTDISILQNKSNSETSLNKNNDKFVSNDISYSSTIIHQTEKVLNDMKEFHHFEIDKSYNITSLTTEECIDIKPLLKNNDKYIINKESSSDIKNTKHYDSFTNDSVPFNDNKEENPEEDFVKKCDEEKLSCDNIFKTNCTNELNCEEMFESPEQSTKKSNRDVETDNAKRNLNWLIDYSHTHSYKEIQKEVLTDEDIKSGKLSNVKIENYISSEDIDELFKDAECFQRYSLDIPKRPPERLTVDQSRHNSSTTKLECKVVDGKDRYINFFKQKQNERNIMKINVEKKKQYHNGKYKKLMALAVTPYHPKGPVQCKLCHSKLRTLANFRAHAKSHFEPEFTCQNCGKKFHSRNHMQYHQQRMHGEEKRLACAHCPFRAVDRPTLRNHERAAHTGERPYACAECGAAFRMRGILRQHMATHFAARDFQCEFCPKMYTRRALLWSHQNKVHLLTYTYHCYLCPETYKAVLPVKRHLASVHGVPQDQQLKIQRVVTRKDGAPNTTSRN